ncbi:hypothetical protein SAMN04488498_11216 [Mesorhizobium albiziae]|uniref:Uncharacterized protein n=1 Tax=Neomesorhizobium albiziae TaxID=335020 RepID=A0A1I4C837_9HYPH|nr:hypothetical protein GCM10007937_11290 [Mesorhizobium albiziae]SFK76241.1 hypothetical protein SAMN04488498_11216 [Mesorhizobium albiziae]
MCPWNRSSSRAHTGPAVAGVIGTGKGEAMKIYMRERNKPDGQTSESVEREPPIWQLEDAIC